MRATARQGQGDTSSRCAPVSIQKDVRTADIGKTAQRRGRPPGPGTGAGVEGSPLPRSAAHPALTTAGSLAAGKAVARSAGVRHAGEVLHTDLSAALATAEALAHEAGRLQVRNRATLTVPGGRPTSMTRFPTSTSPASASSPMACTRHIRPTGCSPRRGRTSPAPPTAAGSWIRSMAHGTMSPAPGRGRCASRCRTATTPCSPWSTTPAHGRRSPRCAAPARR